MATELRRRRGMTRRRKLDAQEERRRADVRRRVFQRDGGCLLHPTRELNHVGRDWGACFGDPLTFHHLLKASHGGEYTEDNGATLCAHHNDAVEDYPHAGHLAGLVIRSWEAK